MRRRVFLGGASAAGTAAAVGALPRPALAQGAAASWPSRPLRLVVPWPPGGTTNILARQIGPSLSAALSQPVVVENRGGASGAIGTAELLRAPPDGHGFAFVTSTLVSAALLSRQPYHPVDDVTPILRLADVANILVVHPALPVRSVRELIAYARERPGRLSFGSPGIGSAVHISGETFKLATGVDMVHAPYRGGGPALADLVGGQIQLMFGNASSTLPHVRSGAVRPIAVTSARRAPYLPDVPSIAEAGVPGFDVVEWYAVIGPANMPPAITERLNREIMAVVGTPEGRARLLDMGAEVVGGTPAEFGAFLRAEVDKIGRVVREARILME
jgi:tripartite-type tricarboxylate transporter receptor subunit TctC